MEGSRVGSSGQPGAGQGPGWPEARGNEVAKKPLGAPRQRPRGPPGVVAETAADGGLCPSARGEMGVEVGCSLRS